MPLPKIDLPRYKHHLYGLNKDIYYRGFTTREQKILLHAKEGENDDQTFEAIKQVVELCTFGEINIEKLPFFDIEDLFIRIRSKSVSDVVNLVYRVKDKDGKPTKDKIEFEINLNDVQVTVPEGHDPKIMLTDDVGVMMKYPPFHVLNSTNNEFELIKQSIDYVFDTEEVYYFKDAPKEEVDEWVDDLDVPALKSIKKFFDTMPRVRYEKEIELPDGEKETIRFEGLSDFFL